MFGKRRLRRENTGDSGFRFDLAAREVSLAGRRRRLEPKAAAVLRLLMESDVPLSRTFLLDRCWPFEGGSDEALTQAVAQIRKALGDSAAAPRYVATVPRHGYRWIFAEASGVSDPPRLLVGRRQMFPLAATLLLSGALGGALLAYFARIETETVTIVRKAGIEHTTKTRRALLPLAPARP